jgi:inosine triphosphate pyrophosphatase
MESKIITYVSGNAGKLAEIQRLNKGFINLSYLDLDLVEIQGTAEEIAIAKCKAAFELVKGPVLIEDSSLYFSNLGGLPGPYIKDFMKRLDLTSLARLGETKYGNTTAQAKCIYAYLDSTFKKPELFIGNTAGKIVYPRSNQMDAFGWDPIFELDMELKNSLHGPVRYLTYAEMPYETKDRYSDRYLAFDKFKEYITTFKKYLN